MPSRNELRKYFSDPMHRITLLEQDEDRADGRMDEIEERQSAITKLLIGALLSLALAALGLAANVLTR